MGLTSGQSSAYFQRVYLHASPFALFNESHVFSRGKASPQVNEVSGGESERSELRGEKRLLRSKKLFGFQQGRSAFPAGPLFGAAKAAPFP